MTLTTNRWLRITTLSVLYFAQGFPWGFMLTGLLSFLASRGLTMAESGQLTAMAYLPWTFKLFWGPLIDSFTYRAMGRRRPWILVAQFGMAASLFTMVMLGDISANIPLLGWMFFLHNCFASLQDVSCDALAVDILLPEEQGKVNGVMWGSKVIGTGMGAMVMGTLLVSKGLVFAITVQTMIMFGLMLLPLLFTERPGEKRFPWSQKEKLLSKDTDDIRNPFFVVKDLIEAFRKRPTLLAAIFILTAAVNQGVNTGIMPVFYNQTLGWEPDTYSQVSGGPGAIFEFIGALLGGILADRLGRRKIFFIGWGGFSVWCGIFGILILIFDPIPYWIQFGHLVIWPFFIAMGTVAMFALTMALSWTNSSATMFTSYMAMANISVVVGTKLIGLFTALFSIAHLYIILMIIGLLPAFLLKGMNPRPIIKLKKLNRINLNKNYKY